ncbi:hypothetical protein VP01_2747g6 [Puccinia sorghi]|uniref:Uncharacterized protein n=1 Tax=Puccinia sorghi TaxID=27349 RepID=A0A0L6V324_9BASI|nr:hypothetical protein VP01_2747g6 [Puccinia sorghi]
MGTYLRCTKFVTQLQFGLCIKCLSEVGLLNNTNGDHTPHKPSNIYNNSSPFTSKHQAPTENKNSSTCGS